MNKLKGIVPYLLAVLSFVIISLAYFSPVIEGKKLSQMDHSHAAGMAQEIKAFEKQTGEKTMWTNSMFGGMPAYQIKGDSSSNLFWYLNNITRMNLPYSTVAIVFLYMLGFYLLLLSLRVDPILSIVGAVAFAFGSFNIIIVAAGHVTQAYAIALMPPVLAGILWAYNRNKWVGGLITAIALGMEIAYNHFQITYYLLITVLVLGLVKLIQAYKEKALPVFAQTTGVLVLAAGLALLPNIANMWTTYEYGKLSNRGKSELTPAEGEKEHSGLDKDYAFGWSYGIHETPTLLVPNVVGGASTPIAADKELMKEINPQVKEFFAHPNYQGLTSQYWGGRPFTSGPMYVGAIICFLFLLGAFYYQGKERWWLIAATILAIVLGWGKNFALFNDFMFYYFPMYNKFRVPEMAIVIATVTMPLLGFLGLKTLYDKPELLKLDAKYFIIAFALTAGFSLLLFLAPGLFYDFMPDEVAKIFAQQKAQGGEAAQYFSLVELELVNARESLLRSDAIRSFFLIVLASASLWFYGQGKLSTKYLTWGLFILIFVDLWGVDKRYLNNDMFQSARKADKEFVASKADQYIFKNELDDYYRVLPIYRDPFNDAYTCYFHKSIGGYHAAKLRRYMDLIDKYLRNDYQTLMETLRTVQTPGELELVMEEMPILNMLNTKYIIYHPNANPIFNPSYMGNAWFVSAVQEVENADEEIEAIGHADLATTAVVDQMFANIYGDYRTDTINGAIQLVTYKPNQLVYESTSTQEQIAVFSDIYYPKGWNCYIDGKAVDHFRANYVLRAAMIPAGDHTIEFKFEPTSYKYGKLLAMISSIIVLVLIGALVYYIVKTKREEN